MLDQLPPAAATLLDPSAAALWLAPAVIAVVVSLFMQDANQHKRHLLHVVVGFLAFAYVVAIAAIVLWPWDFQASGNALRFGNWVPVRGSIGFLLADDAVKNYLGEQQVVVHLLLLAPLGLLLPIVFGGVRSMAVVFSLAIVAFYVPTAVSVVAGERLFDIDHGIAAFTGGLAGAVATNVSHAAASLGRLAVR
jgi:glycopeptide antibiotics resistance protein